MKIIKDKTFDDLINLISNIKFFNASTGDFMTIKRNYNDIPCVYREVNNRMEFYRIATYNDINRVVVASVNDSNYVQLT